MHIIVHPTGRNSFEFSVPLKLRRAYIVLQIIQCPGSTPPPKRRVYPKRLERARLTGCDDDARPARARGAGIPPAARRAPRAGLWHGGGGAGSPELAGCLCEESFVKLFVSEF